MSDREEWGPWVDGTICPPKGRYIRLDLISDEDASKHILHECIFLDLLNGEELHLSPPMPGTGTWTMDRWQERKPRALQQLREMIETLPAPRQKEDA